MKNDSIINNDLNGDNKMNKKVRFADIKTSYSENKKRFRGWNPEIFYNQVIDDLEKSNNDYQCQRDIDLACIEYSWYQSQKPYYKLYPSVMDAFLETNCDVSPENIRMPHGCFVIKLPQDGVCVDLEGKDSYSTPLFIYVSDGIVYSVINGNQCDNYCSRSHFDFKYDDGFIENVSSFLFKHNLIGSGNRLIPDSIRRTINISLIYNDNYKEGARISSDLFIDNNIEQDIKTISKDNLVFSQYIRAALGVIFCATGSHKVLEYDVLSEHLEAYRKLKDGNERERKKYEFNARKKGKFGWCIGRDGRELKLPNGISDCIGKGLGKRELSYSFIRGGHWRSQAYGSKWSKKKTIWIPDTSVRSDLPPIIAA